ncbi:MAG: hypothetical protein IKB92_02225 [Clostridia bacterium]|nr:hypothetical protein [Clostridia bacterium]
MTNISPKNIALKTLLKHKYYSLDNYVDLQHIVESCQFTIIEYKKHSNSEPVTELIQRLGIENETQQHDSFIYIKNNLRFVFLHTDSSDEDKCVLLRHELGHISDPNFINGRVGYSDIKKEEFANEFSFYIKNPGIRFKLKLFIIKKWKLLVSVMALISLLSVLFVTIGSHGIKPAKSVSGDLSAPETSGRAYYITSSGKKYHRKHCIIVKYKNNLTELTLHEAINAGYKPCLICYPAEE